MFTLIALLVVGAAVLAAGVPLGVAVWTDAWPLWYGTLVTAATLGLFFGLTQPRPTPPSPSPSTPTTGGGR